MRSFLLPIFLLFVTTSFTIAQDNAKKYHFGAHLTPSLTNGLISDSDNVEFEQSFSYGLGVDFIYNIRSYWQFRTGIQFTRVNFEEIDYSLVFGCDLLLMDELDDFRRNSYFVNEYGVGILSIPIINRFFLSNQSNRPFVEIGLEPSFRISSDNNSTLFECGTATDVATDFTDEINDLLWNAFLSFGLAFDANEKSKLTVAPFLRYSLTPFNKDVNALVLNEKSYHTLQYGIQLGVYF